MVVNRAADPRPVEPVETNRNLRYPPGMLAVIRFRVGPLEADELRTRLEAALQVLAAQKGYVEGWVGRNVDDPGLWLLQTRWADVGSYRRAISSYDVKVSAQGVLSRSVNEPSAYEIVRPGDPS